MRPADRILEGRQRVTAFLGPTNTGKTHRAIQRMLRHPSGMIGLPLRLLAREVYDRVVAIRGPAAVALITGEEKRVPKTADYFVCTVEAMPLDRTVAYVAVDEIQLAGDRNRGHVFTDRILHARGVLETVFLGSDTIAPLLTELVPGVQIERMPRMSRLRWAGVERLSRVPPRSAVVAFSAEQVYRRAEALRSVHGGVAVVLGALSPRTRNAQVALYESGEVKHLVATDAIGMGLNMDVHHVAFAGLRKFDGRRFRDLRLDEVAQIAGRAGRHTRDGTFGTLREVGPLDPGAIEALETHQFRPLRRLFWRNSGLDLRSAATLLDSLRERAPHPVLKPVYDEDDHLVLEELVRRGDLPLDGEEAVRVLWEVCRVPDFRKTLTGQHADLLHQIAGFLLGSPGTLPDDWVDKRLKQLDRPQGDIDALMARIAFGRTWTYVSHQRGWLRDPVHWQERTRQLEDRLSDALHEALRRRFVGERQGSGRRHQHRADPEELGRKERVDAAPDEAFELDFRGHWWVDGLEVGGLIRGPDPTSPRAVASRKAFPTQPLRTAVRERLRGLAEERLQALFAPLRGEGLPTPAASEILAAVEEGLGSCRRDRVRHAVSQLDDRGRRALAARGIRLGRSVVYAPALLEPEAVGLRSALWSVFHEEPGRLVPGGAPPSFPRTEAAPDRWLEAIGYAHLGPLAVRADVYEQVRARARKGRGRVPADWLKGVLGCLETHVEPVRRALR